VKTIEQLFREKITLIIQIIQETYKYGDYNLYFSLLPSLTAKGYNLPPPFFTQIVTKQSKVAWYSHLLE
jgi:hypothetical protein